MAKIRHMQKGQIFTTLLFFVIIGMTIITAEVIVIFTNIFSSGIAEQGASAYYAAESGVEEALIRLKRDPQYSGGVLSVGSGSVNIQVNSNTIEATGSYGNTVRKIQVKLINENGVLKIESWKEI